MPTIRDRELRTAYTALETKRQADPTTKIDANSMMKLLAAVGDTWSRGEAGILADLSKPGVTRDQQLDLVKKGMSAKEKTDLVAILDQGTVPMTDDVKRFLNQVVGREDVVPNDGALHILGDQAGGVVKGVVAPGTTIEAINLSTAPEARLHTDDTFVLAKAGADGKFSGKLPDVKEGDIIRVRTRDAAGNAGNWLTIRAKGLSASDTRNTQVAVFRIGVTDNKDGTVGVENINASRPLAEPGASLLLVNTRTNEKTKVTIDEEGNFPKGFKVPGKGGDVFSVRASDGTNNADFSVEAGKVTVPGGTNNGGGTGVIKDLPDPKLHKDECAADGTPRFSTKRFSGPLFKDGINCEDAKQGQLGDCYFPSAMAALAKANPEAIKNAIKENGDGTYTVTFKERQGWSGGYKDKQVTVDGDLYVRAWGGPLYGSSAGDTSEKNMEMWFPIIEKAYAQYKGGYNSIGNGGVSSDVFEAFLGRSSDYTHLGGAGSESKAWSAIKGAIDQGFPVSAGTYGEDEKAKYTNTGVYPDHSYSVLGYEEKDGKKLVILRNPWGESEPFPGDGKNDGIFKLPVADFVKLYQSVMTVS